MPGIQADAKETGGSIAAHLFCSLFLVTTAVALSAVTLVKADTVGAVASPRANQGSMRLGNALPGNIIVVTNTNDSGLDSLRQALADANDGDTINFDLSVKGQTITLTSGQLNVDKDVTVRGFGATNLAVDGNAQSRVFYVNPNQTVTVSGLSIINANVTNDVGGGIYNDGCRAHGERLHYQRNSPPAAASPTPASSSPARRSNGH